IVKRKAGRGTSPETSWNDGSGAAQLAAAQRITRAGTRVSRFSRDVALMAAEPQGRSAARLAAPMSTAHTFPKPTVSFDLTTSALGRLHGENARRLIRPLPEALVAWTRRLGKAELDSGPFTESRTGRTGRMADESPSNCCQHRDG